MMSCKKRKLEDGMSEDEIDTEILTLFRDSSFMKNFMKDYDLEKKRRLEESIRLLNSLKLAISSEVERVTVHNVDSSKFMVAFKKTINGEDEKYIIIGLADDDLSAVTFYFHNDKKKVVKLSYAMHSIITMSNIVFLNNIKL